MASYAVRKGLDIKLVGAPSPTISEAPAAPVVTVSTADYNGIKPRMKVKEGDVVKRGAALFYDKSNEAFNVCSPAGGSVKQIVFGPRHALESVSIQVDPRDEAESFTIFNAAQVKGLKRDVVLAHLQATGLLALIRQRPFSRMANPTAEPKSIFVNAMNTGPLQPDVNIMLKGRELAFQAGLDALTTLTKGKVHLCIDGQTDHGPALNSAKNIEVHTFSGPHPAGNTSIHISRIDPIKPHDIVWSARASDVALMGELFIHGEWPATRIVALAGSGVNEAARKYYRVRMGAPLQSILGNALAAGEQRIIRGDVLTGVKTTADKSIALRDNLFTVIPEDRTRHFLGWMAPGMSAFSASKAFLSGWIGRTREWALGTNQHGELRPMVLTGLYDKYLPMNIWVDYLIRAILANDTEEAVKLGILETDPEDFALCAFVCPSKMDLVGIVRRGLMDIEKEGI